MSRPLTSPDLHSLLDRVRKATGPDAVLDAEIAATIGPIVMRQASDGSYAFFDRRRDNMCFLCNVRSAPFDELSTCLSVPSYSSSLDAVVALIEEKLPGWQRASGTCGEQDMPWACLTEPDEPCRDFAADAPDEVLALLASLLQALIEVHHDEA